MRNVYILNVICCVLLVLTGCGTIGLNPPTPKSTQPISVLDGLTLEKSRDVIIRINPDAHHKLIGFGIDPTTIKTLSLQENIYRVQIKEGKSLLNTLQLLNQQAYVKYAEPNYPFSIPDYKIQGFSTTAVQPNDDKFGLQWNMKSSKVNEAWELTTGDNSLTVAVIDSGVDPNHPDLSPHLLTLEDVWARTQGSDIFTDPFSRQTINFGGKDGNGHGTHVTGVIGAVMNNGQGVAGVAGGGIKILPIKATDYSGNTDAAVLTNAFQTAINKGAHIINISIGGPRSKSTRALEDVVKQALDKGIPIIAATGNESARFRNSIQPVSVPAGYPGVIAIGAHTEFNRVASYSNGGVEVDMVAPGGGGRDLRRGEGQQIWSTWPTYATSEFFAKRTTSTHFAATSGTSMACPHVTGVVALMRSREPLLSPQQIRARLIATADDIETPGFDTATGYGKLNAIRALRWTGHDAQD